MVGVFFQHTEAEVLFKASASSIMKDYKNMSCAACGVAFDEDSDIVVCPVCGAPHHRDCWKTAGHCACEERHAQDYEWEPERIVIGASSEGAGHKSENPPEQKQVASPTVICPNCGRETPKKGGYCERCGYYIGREQKDAFSWEGEFSDIEQMFQFEEAEPINGVPAGDIRRFVGGMWIYYIPRFIKMARNKSSISFNFTAFLTSGLWFISRKMYVPGVLLMLLNTAISGYQVYFSTVMSDLTGSRLGFGSLLYMLLSALEGVIMLLSGLFGNKLYMDFCARKIKKINARATAAHADAEQFNRAMEEEGGIAIIPVLSVGICYFAVLYILQTGFLF